MGQMLYGSHSESTAVKLNLGFTCKPLLIEISSDLKTEQKFRFLFLMSMTPVGVRMCAPLPEIPPSPLLSSVLICKDVWGIQFIVSEANYLMKSGISECLTTLDRSSLWIISTRFRSNPTGYNE
ncbi:hypothetical protein TNCV_4688161 [Trichonephila clavipes]|nr:hypothetical protein TNCV_4688161 [Trichonephila clavipes]